MVRSVLAPAWIAFFGCGALAMLSCNSSAQSGMFGSSQPTIGASSGMQIPAPPPSMFGESADTQVLRHRDFTGRPCLDVNGYAEPHIINPKLYDHVITAVNHCPQRIAIRVCYYQSQDCIPMEIPGDERKEAVLGTMPVEKDFRFEFREKF